MEGLAVMGFVFGMIGVVAFARLLVCSFAEINRNAKRKRSFGSGLQGRINDCCRTLCNCGVEQRIKNEMLWR